MMLVRDQKTVQLEENAKIVGETQTLTSPHRDGVVHGRRAGDQVPGAADGARA